MTTSALIEAPLQVKNVRTYTARIYKKLHVHSRAQAVAKYNGTLA
ncbi:MAG: DNA-binding response regulator [Spartobacteria bacterium]|nr:DNA-binding response regulator [Spartobacteria bacterium]